ncbi:MAG: UPF0158 family protein [Ferruginibacter sp.]
MVTFSSEQIKEISEQLDCGFRALYHKKSGELIFVPDTDQYFDMDTDAWKEEFTKLKKNGSSYQEIYAMDSNDSFKVMGDFAQEVANEKLQQELLNALNRKKPFSQFKFIIDNSGVYRQQWFDFKNKRYLEWTKDQLSINRTE